MSDAIDVWNEYKLSGKPYIHPETKKNLADIPLVPDPPKVTVPKLHGIWPKIFFGLSVLFFLAALWLVYQPDPVKALKDLAVGPIQNPLLGGSPLQDRSHYSAVQDLALENLKAWERMTQEAIDLFYMGTPEPGYRWTLCISTGPKKDCTVKENPIDLP